MFLDSKIASGFVSLKEITKLLRVSTQTIFNSQENYPPIFQIAQKGMRFTLEDDLKAFISSSGKFRTSHELKTKSL